MEQLLSIYTSCWTDIVLVSEKLFQIQCWVESWWFHPNYMQMMSGQKQRLNTRYSCLKMKIIANSSTRIHHQLVCVKMTDGNCFKGAASFPSEQTSVGKVCSMGLNGNRGGPVNTGSKLCCYNWLLKVRLKWSMSWTNWIVLLGSKTINVPLVTKW